MSKQFLPEERMNSLGLNWQDLFNPSLAIHANRDLNMSLIKLIGFDMDYTLAVYKKRPMEYVQYVQARAFLVEHMNYPQEILTTNYEADLAIRGLVIDKHLGNILKVDDQNGVWRARHGKKPLSKEQIAANYGTKRVKISDDRFYSLDTFFSIPEACLFIDILDCLEKRPLVSLPKTFRQAPGDMPNYEKIFHDIRFAMDAIHSNGQLKNVICDRLGDFIVQDRSIVQALRKMRAEGKKTFLLTNSNLLYTDTVLSFVLGEPSIPNKSWMDLFDWVITSASKPKFFTESLPFSSNPVPHKNMLEGGNIYDFQKITGCFGPEVLYVGDHIYGDVVRTKKESFWRTCLIIKELNFDIRKSVELSQEIRALHEIHLQQLQTDKKLMRFRTLRAMLQNPLQGEDLDEQEALKLLDLIQNEIKQATSLLKHLTIRYAQLNRIIDDQFHPRWGRLFRERRELSRFGAQVRQYACIYTDHVKNFLHYGANHNFLARKVHMSHEMDEGS